MEKISVKSSVYKRNPATAGRVIDGSAFVVTPTDNKLHTLNGTATRLWELASEGCTVEGAADELVAHYEVERDTALRDVETCFRDLVARHILVVHE